MSKQKTIILAAGGTGGHLFPAYALGTALRGKGYDVLLLTDTRGQRFVEKYKQPIPYKIISSDTIGAGIGGKIKSAWRIGIGTLQSLCIHLQYRTSAVVAFGGYPCFPPALAATLLRKPIILHEQNALLGRANRVLAFFATKIATSFEHVNGVSPKLRSKIIHTGNPLRPDIMQRSLDFKYHAPKEGHPLNLLVVGGSQGATIFSEVVPQAITQLPEHIRHEIALIQQTRLENLNDVQKQYDALTFNIPPILNSFIDNMGDALAQAHLVITRAGASTVAELLTLGIPAIYVPLAASLDGDQAMNAKGVIDNKGGWMLNENEFTPENLSKMLEELLTSPETLYNAAIHCKKMGQPYATENLLTLVETTIV